MMVRNRKHRQDIVLQYLKKYKGRPTRTIARLLYQEQSDLFHSLESARGIVRYFRGSIGSHNRNKALDQTHYDTTPRAWGQLPPKSLSMDWEPYYITTKRNLILPDIHIPFHDEAALEAALRYGDEYLPDGVILAGDAWDCMALSVFNMNPYQRHLKEEAEAMRGFLRHLAERFAYAKIIYKLGNHEERLRSYLWSQAPECWGPMTRTLWFFDLVRVRSFLK